MFLLSFSRKCIDEIILRRQNKRSRSLKNWLKLHICFDSHIWQPDKWGGCFCSLMVGIMSHLKWLQWQMPCMAVEPPMTRYCTYVRTVNSYHGKLIYNLIYRENVLIMLSVMLSPCFWVLTNFRLLAGTVMLSLSKIPLFWTIFFRVLS
jgi:hypothetical protein